LTIKDVATQDYQLYITPPI